MLISHKHKWIFIHVPKNGGSTVASALIEYADLEGAEYKELNLGHKFKSDKVDANFFQHDTATVIKEKFNEQGLDYDSYFKFGIVRHPLSRLVSKWNYWHKLVRKGEAFPYAQHVVSEFKNFKDWLIRGGADSDMMQGDYLYESDRCQGESLRSMSSFVKESRDWSITKPFKGPERRKLTKSFCDRIVHMENYEQELSSVFDEISKKCGQTIHPYSYDMLREKTNATKHKCYAEYFDDEATGFAKIMLETDMKLFGYE